VDFTAILPEILVCLTALAVIAADLFVYQDERRRRGLMAFISAAGLSLALGFLIGSYAGGYIGLERFFGAFIPDHMSLFFRFALLISALLTVMLSIQYVQDKIRHAGEFYALICLATLGAMFLSAAAEMLTLYLSLELLSLSSFILVALRKDNAKSAEASLKYLIFGALSSGLLLYGLSLVFGMTGSIQYAQVNGFLAQNAQSLVTREGFLALQPLLAMFLVLGGLSYKIAAVPFHMWAPDVYEGAPLPVTAFLSVSSKLAGFAALIRIVEMFDSTSLSPVWARLLFILAVLSMTLGNVLAIAQRDLKRMFAYSSIAQAGYLLLGVAALSNTASRDTALAGLLFYLLVYVFMNLGAFAAITHLSKQVASTEIIHFSGMGTKAPWFAFVLSCCLLSLTGLPPFAGFTGKFYLFGAVAQMGTVYLGLVAVGALNSVLSLYYYSKIIRVLYFGQSRSDLQIYAPHPAMMLASVVSFVGILGLFLFPSPVLDFIATIHSLL
jgi:proton-translocating NADH-quinone oxidoreductase chain N